MCVAGSLEIIVPKDMFKLLVISGFILLTFSHTRFWSDFMSKAEI